MNKRIFSFKDSGEPIDVAFTMKTIAIMIAALVLFSCKPVDHSAVQATPQETADQLMKELVKSTGIPSVVITTSGWRDDTEATIRAFISKYAISTKTYPDLTRLVIAPNFQWKTRVYTDCYEKEPFSAGLHASTHEIADKPQLTEGRMALVKDWLAAAKVLCHAVLEDRVLSRVNLPSFPLDESHFADEASRRRAVDAIGPKLLEKLTAFRPTLKSADLGIKFNLDYPGIFKTSQPLGDLFHTYLLMVTEEVSAWEKAFKDGEISLKAATAAKLDLAKGGILVKFGLYLETSEIENVKQKLLAVKKEIVGEMKSLLLVDDSPQQGPVSRYDGEQTITLGKKDFFAATPERLRGYFGAFVSLEGPIQGSTDVYLRFSTWTTPNLVYCKYEPGKTDCQPDDAGFNLGVASPKRPKAFDDPAFPQMQYWESRVRVNPADYPELLVVSKSADNKALMTMPIRLQKR